MVLSELIDLLKNADSAMEIDRKRAEIGELIPAVKIMFDYNQQNHAHQYDLWMHSLNVVVNLPRDMEDDMLYLAALFHDIGKPVSGCRSNRPDDMNMHYYGHPQKSKKLKHLNRHLKMVSFEEFKNLMLLQVADAKAHVQLPIIAERVEICSALAGEEGEAL